MSGTDDAAADRPTPSRRRIPLRVLGVVAGMVLVLSLVAMATAVEITSRPQFCGSCHIMQPYYQSWTRSSHRNVACVECHIAPGMTAEIRKKYEALSMVARYVTGTYGTNPWTEIDDAACLRCHERRLLTGKELFAGVLFDHAAHLSGMRRGKQLRCTSCHSQIVQGSHIAVTSSTCILCHFKGRVSNTGSARCTLCHRVPDKTIRRGSLTFNHADVARYGMDCTSCHARPAGSDGAVPRERCVTCHNQPDRLAHFGETDYLHQEHVTRHKVDCTTCHLEIQHVAKPHIVETATGTGCDTCHSSQHSPQQSFYAGSGGRGVASMPDPMFLAGVRCEGCHMAIPGREEATHRASSIACMSCHGPRFDSLFRSWQDGLRSRTAGLKRQIDQAASALGRPAPASLDDARANLDLVVRAGGVHNIGYAYALLRRAHDDLNAARRDRGLETVSAPWREPPYDSPCLACHQAIEDQRGALFGRAFAHAPHVVGARIDCEACHRPHAERAPGEVVRFDAAGCDSCHHKDAGAASGCLSCHAGVKGRTVSSPRGPFDHALHIDSVGLACADCHEVRKGEAARLKTGTCATCHA